jgi:RNA polymerase sigma factor (sigma-70 family)
MTVKIFCPESVLEDTRDRVNDVNDEELLRQYVRDRSEASFAALVQRHIDWVYSAALRMVRDTHLAEDVTQGVFLALARGAAKIEHGSVLSGWLHGTTRNLAAATVRSEVRRRTREKEAAIMNQYSSETTALWEQLAPYLDEALGRLSAADRDAVLLRYFERKTAREIGERLGISEEAAQKRVMRVLDELRGLLHQRGVTVSASALAAALSMEAVQAAPSALAASVTATSLATLATTPGSGLLNLMASAKLKFSLVSLIAAGMTTAVVVQTRTNARLRAELAERDAQVRPLEMVSDQPASKAVDADEIAALRAEHAELLRLRGEIAALRQQDRQRGRAAQKRLSGADTSRVTGDFVTADNWKDVGADTPEHAFQSFLAALKTGAPGPIESAVYWELNWKEDVTEEDRKLVEKSKQDYLEMLLRAPNKVTAFSLAPVGKSDESERTRVFFHTLTGDGTDVASSFEMVRSDGRWKPVLSMGWRYPKEPSSFYTSPVFGPAIDLER